MIARITFPELAAACFPVAGCSVRGSASRQGYSLTLFPPQPFAGPTAYTGTGATCYEALAAAVRLFHDSAHASPAARPLAAAGSYSPPPQPQEFPHDDDALRWPQTIRTEQTTAHTMQRLHDLTSRLKSA